MTPHSLEPAHHAAILRNNAQYVHWLSPLDSDGLETLLSHATYARQLGDGEAVIIAYPGDGPYRHKNVDWLSDRLDNYLYIDRVIVGRPLQGQGAGRALYADLEAHARRSGFSAIACEVNIRPDNPSSHAFHAANGFAPIGEDDYGTTAVRYYAKPLQ